MEQGAEGLTSAPPDPVVYCDASALARAYLPDEPGHLELTRLLLDPDRPIVTSALAEVEIAAAIRGAARRGRVGAADQVMAEILADMGETGHIELIALNSRRVLPRARDLCEAHRLRALDAIHLAVALLEEPDLAGEEGLVFVTRDSDQAAAARAEGLRVE